MCLPSTWGRGFSLFSAPGAEATLGHGESPGHKDSSVWGQVGLFRSGELSDAKSVAPGCGAYDSVLWPFWNREGGGVCQSPWTRTVSQTSATGTVTGFPFPLAPPLSCQPPPPLFSLLSPASFSCILCSASSPPSSCPFFSPSFQGDLSPPPGNRFLQTIWSHSLPFLISPVHPLQHAATAEMF